MSHPICATLIAITLLAGVPAAAQDAVSLAGGWTVDLRPTPQAPAYYKPMALVVAADGTLTGSFYERDIDSGRAGATDGRPCFAFRTQDASGPYQTAGCLVDGRIAGQTWSEGRKFILAWTAVRNPGTK